MDDKAQMREYQLARRFEVFLVTESMCQGLLVLFAQDSNATNGLNIGVEAADRAGKHEIMVCGHKGCSHTVSSSGRILALVTLEC
jgi:hypothetical protein